MNAGATSAITTISAMMTRTAIPSFRIRPPRARPLSWGTARTAPAGSNTHRPEHKLSANYDSKPQRALTLYTFGAASNSQFTIYVQIQEDTDSNRGRVEAVLIGR